MAIATGGAGSRRAAAQRPIFGPAVWGWALASGFALWCVGFVLLPWWAALLLWWWPSVVVGAAVGLAAISIVKLVARVTKRRYGRPRPNAEPASD